MNFKDLNWKEPGMQKHVWVSNFGSYPFWVQRDDLIHPIVSGNKSRKLQGWLAYYQEQNFEGIVTFGGAFSNHLIATASVCGDLKIPCVGLIRGDEGFSNPYLDYCHSRGMELIFVSRSDYRNKDVLSADYQNYQGRRNLVIPEGGRGELGLVGFDALVATWELDFPDIVVHASATATTAAGILKAIQKRNAHTRVFPVLVLKNEAEQVRTLKEWNITDGFELITDYHFGGYAKTDDTLLAFIEQVQLQFQLPLDPVYSGKAFYALIHEVIPNHADKKICFLHTGGCFGNP